MTVTISKRIFFLLLFNSLCEITFAGKFSWKLFGWLSVNLICESGAIGIKAFSVDWKFFCVKKSIFSIFCWNHIVIFTHKCHDRLNVCNLFETNFFLEKFQIFMEKCMTRKTSKMLRMTTEIEKLLQCWHYKNLSKHFLTKKNSSTAKFYNFFSTK